MDIDLKQNCITGPFAEIADFVGKKYSKEMRLLVKKGKEFAPEPPDDPKADKEGKISEVDKLTFKSEYDKQL